MNKCLPVKETRKQETEFEGISSLALTQEGRTDRDLDLRHPGRKIRPYISKFCQASFNVTVQLKYIFSINGDPEPTFPSLSAATFHSQ